MKPDSLEVPGSISHRHKGSAKRCPRKLTYPFNAVAIFASILVHVLLLPAMAEERPNTSLTGTYHHGQSWSLDPIPGFSQPIRDVQEQIGLSDGLPGAKHRYPAHHLLLAKNTLNKRNDDSVTRAESFFKDYKSLTIGILAVVATLTIVVIGLAVVLIRLRRVQAELETSETNFRRIVETAEEGIWGMDAEYRTTFVNQRMAKMLGYSVEEMIGKPVDSFVPEEELANHMRQMKLRSDNVASIYEKRLLKKDGTIVWAIVSGTSIFNGERGFAGGFALFTDVTERKNDEMALRDSEARFQRLVKLAPLPLALIDEHGAVSYVNDRFVQVFGYALDEIPTLEAWRKLAYPDEQYRQKVIQAWEAAVERASNEEVAVKPAELQVTCKNGEVRSVEISVIALDGDFLTTLVDVTECREMEDGVRREKDKLRNILDHMNDGVFIVDDQFEIRYINPALEKVFGPIEGRKCYQYFDDLTEPCERCKNPQVLSGETIQWEWHAEKVGRTYELFDTPIGNAHGTISKLEILHDITDRKLAEEELRASEERLRLFIEHAPTALAMFDHEMRYLAASRRWRTDYSLGDQPILGRGHYELLPEIPERWKQVHRRGMAGEVIRAEEDSFMREDGTVQWIRWEVRPWFKPDGSIGGIVIFAEEISERKLAEEALRESEQRFSQVAESVGDWIWEVDEKGLYRYCSPAVERILGYSRQELEGRLHFYDLFAPEVKEELYQKAFEIFGRTEKFHNFLNQNVRKDGQTALLETSGSPILDDQGHLIGYRGVDRDVTEQRRMQEAQRMLAIAVEQAVDAVIVTDIAGNIEYVNPAFENSTGFAREEVLAKNARVLKSGVHSDSFYRDIWAVITRGHTWRGRLTNKRKDGSMLLCESIIAPVKDEKGSIMHYVGVNRDITESEILRERLAQAQKMEAIGTLAGGIAHDFNNMLFAMTGYTELAVDSLPGDSQIREDLLQVLSAGQRASEMVKQILTFSRQTDTARMPLDLTPLVKEGMKFLRASIPTTVEIKQNFQPDLGKVYGDPTQIHQVLMNFCTNAAHAMRDTKGILSVELAGVELDGELTATDPELLPGKYVRLTVGDTGTGMPPEVLARIFEPYFTTKAVGEGTGLGLSVVHGIVKSHGGTISVYSETGIGTTFHVYFPVIEHDSTAALEHTIKYIPSGRERILLVDDEPVLAGMYRAMLERLGYYVATETDPVEALDFFRTDPQQFDLVITDFTMPKMTGEELALELKRIRPELPIILCTGFSGSLSELRLREAGIAALVRKPILKKDIAWVIREVLDKDS